MIISTIALFAPLLISTTSPLTGEAYMISGLFLLKNMESPAFTSAPTSTNIFGIGDIPIKSVGLRAYLMVNEGLYVWRKRA